VAARYGLPLRSLRERAWRREFEHVRIGRERYMTDEQIAEFVRANTVASKRDDDLGATRQRVARRRKAA